MGIAQSGVVGLEEREPSGKVTLERLSAAARAMNCRLIYAVVPDTPYSNLDGILDQRARRLAEHLIHRTEHSMRLEEQSATEGDLQREIDALTSQLKTTSDPRLWQKGDSRKKQ
jgi:predicted DNA-binding mobile mystery protein A